MALKKTNTNNADNRNSFVEDMTVKTARNDEARAQKMEEKKVENAEAEEKKAKVMSEQEKIRAAKEERMRRLIEKQMNRTIARSMKIDAHTEAWLTKVKEYRKKELGEVRPCLDDLYFDALQEYLHKHYDALEPKREQIFI